MECKLATKIMFVLHNSTGEEKNNRSQYNYVRLRVFLLMQNKYIAPPVAAGSPT